MTVMSVEEFARTYRISKRHAYALVRRGSVPSIRLGRSIRVMVPASWVPDAVRAGEQEAARQPDEPRA